MMSSALWRRLDLMGHDAARLDTLDDGYLLRGTAVFRDPAGPARLAYLVVCARDWTTRRGRVTGRIGARDVNCRVVRDAGGWTLNGERAESLDHCVDLDFGFTPATNLQQLKRIALAVGASAEVPVAWLDTSDALMELPQTYERRSQTTYWYKAPSVGYAGLLELAPSGFIHRYPGLWEAEG